ncbi:MAG: class I SAM-dependent methyltransferase [Paracoccaceae bacterium]
MISTELTDWFNARWVGDMGAIDGQDVAFIADLIEQERPRNVVEIGCASGMSSCILASLLSSAGGGTIHSFDLMERYYVNPEKPVGYLLDEAPSHPGVGVTVHRGKTCLDVVDHIDGPIDLCFIDAAHKHPWPLIDTLCILPLMKPGGLIIHHDLQMFRSTHGDNYANGPKMMFVIAPHASRIYPDDANQARGRAMMKSRHGSHNIFALRVPQSHRAYGSQICEGFYLGWDKQSYRLIPLEFADRFAAFLAENYGPYVGQAWNEGMRRYSPPADDPLSSPPPVTAPGLARRIWRKLRAR